MILLKIQRDKVFNNLANLFKEQCMGLFVKKVGTVYHI